MEDVEPIRVSKTMKKSTSWLMDDDWNQVQNVETLWALAWFGVIIWVISTAGPVVYPVFGFLLALRLVAMRYKKKNQIGILNISSGLFAPDLLIAIALTVHAFLNLDRVTNYSVWQALTGLSLAGTIISGLLVVYKFLRMGISGDTKVKSPRIMWISLYSNTAWTLAWFGIAIWLVSSHPSYAVSALLLTLRLGSANQYKTWMQWFQKGLLSGALVAYVVLVENSTTYSPWAALVAMASIGLALDVLSGIMIFMIDENGKVSFKFSASGLVKAVRKAEKILLSNNIQMRTPTTGLRQK